MRPQVSLYVELKKKEFENKHIEFNRGSVPEDRAADYAAKLQVL